MRIRLNQIALEAIIGFFPEERVKKQPVVISVTFEVDPKEAIAADDVNYTVDYNQLTEDIAALVIGSQFQLLEKLTHSVLALVMEKKRVRWAEVEVEKPEAPVRFIQSVVAKASATREEWEKGIGD